MAQLLPEGLRDPAASDVVAEDDTSISYGKSWSMHLGTRCGCGKNYPHLEVYGGRPIPTDGLTTLTQWIRIALSVERYQFPIYDTDYGVEFEALISRSPTEEEVETEVPRMIREALEVDPRVLDVREVQLSVDDEDPTSYLADMEIITFTGDLEAIETAVQLEVS
jgi:hypothetical protein